MGKAAYDDDTFLDRWNVLYLYRNDLKFASIVSIEKMIIFDSTKVIRSLLDLISIKHYCVFWVSIIFPACMMLSLGGHCFVCYIVFSTKAEYRIEENLKEIMNEGIFATKCQN
jgi:hypothetical protein